MNLESIIELLILYLIVVELKEKKTSYIVSGSGTKKKREDVSLSFLFGTLPLSVRLYYIIFLEKNTTI